MGQLDREDVAGDKMSPAIFRREGDVWAIAYRGEIVRLRDSVGLAHLAELLRRPGEPMPATELVGLPAPAGEVDRERARVRATRAIRSAVARIRAHNPSLAEHLQATVRTGAKCAYVPDPRIGARWSL